ncbi:hypothetical protein V6N13_034155 [Hibiscus sabdariffa]
MVDEWGSIIARSRWLANVTQNALAGRRSLSQSGPDASLPIPGWTTPPTQWVRLNCDGAHMTRDSNSSCGGVLRDSAGFRSIVVETDCLDAIRLLRRPALKGSPITLVRDIRRLCNQEWRVSFHHVSRFNNRVTDSLARLASPSNFDVLHFDAPPLGIVHLLREDVLFSNA